MNYARVKWFDASHQRGELTAEEMNRRCEIVSAGIVVHDDETGVSLAQDYFDADETYRHISHIPRCNIIDVRYFGYLAAASPTPCE